MTANQRREHLNVYMLDRVEYAAASELQDALAAEIGARRQPDSFLLLEHPHVYTFGRRGDAQNMLWTPDDLARKGIAIHWTDRGGDVTYHGPGQLIGYPLIDLGAVRQDGRLPQADYVGYIRNLEKVIIKALAELGVVSGQVPDLTGVWVQPDVASRCRHCPPAARRHPSKIASIGVKVDARGVSRHGFAINVDPDMSYWEGIIACGIAEYPAISLVQLLDPAPSKDEVTAAVIEAFREVFGYRHVHSTTVLPAFESRSH